MSRRVDLASERAFDDARRPPADVAPAGAGVRRRAAIGDPQAPLERFLSILDAQGLLGDDGRLAPDVQLVSMGDHFDWGSRDERPRAAREALALLSWLAAHPPDRVYVLAGNHDLGRLGELARFDDVTFRAAQAEADAIYWGPARSDEAHEREFKARFPDLPTSEVAARDFSTFEAAQRELVLVLTRSGRMQLALAVGPMTLLTHAGVTSDHLDAAGLASEQHSDAIAIADALSAKLLDAARAFDGTPLALHALHWPGSAQHGEGRGMLYHRPSNPVREGWASPIEGSARRRFDPRRLPLGLTQAIGHIRDRKCRELLFEWSDAEPAGEGRLRSLETDGTNVRYRRGIHGDATPGSARMLFLDGAMHTTVPEDYELLDLDTLAVLRRDA